MTMTDWYESNVDRIHREFFDFLKFESISTDPSYKDQVLGCADFVENYVRDMGFKVERWPTKGYPTIYGEWLEAGPDKPTVLIYNHYDVQPVDPLELWDSPPFEPEVRDGEVYARGAQDNKGQCFYVMQALRSLFEREGKLPVNVKVCIEGEEECGSAGLAGILEERRQQLAADYLLVVDVGLHHADAPSVTLGVRGMVSMSVEVQGSHGDLHSGTHGGIAYNPNHALVEMLAKLRDSNGRITVPGFYDGVEEVSAEEQKEFKFAVTPEDYRELFGAEPNGGEKGRSMQESGSLRPTLEINGIGGGYTGIGFKTVIPAKAQAKISCRIVPGQDPDRIGNGIADYLQELAPEGMKVTVDVHAGHGRAMRSNPSSGIAHAYSQAYSEVFGKPCARILEGASIPIIADMTQVCQAEALLIGLGLGDDNIHAPNEHFGIDRLKRGCAIVARGLEILGSA